MTPENKLLLKRALVAVGAVLLFGVLFVAPCVGAQHSTTPSVAADAATTAECDGSCPWPKPEAAPPTKTFAQENWQLTLPDTNWASVPTDNPDIKMALMTDEPQQLLILFIKEQLEDGETLADYAVDTIRAFAFNEFQINGVKQLVIHDQKFVMAQVSKGQRVIWAFMSAKDGNGYAFTCGGDINVDAGSAQRDVCANAAQTIQIQ